MPVTIKILFLIANTAQLDVETKQCGIEIRGDRGFDFFFSFWCVCAGC